MPARSSARAACASAACRRTCRRGSPTGRCARCCTRRWCAIGQDDDWWRIDVLLDEIGVEPEILDKKFGELSGGWQRLMLIAAAARLEEPDILILDEPTNHLDLANINTLERWLTVEFEIPMLIVSHDREILDRVTERTLFLRSDGVHAFKTLLLGGARGAAAPRRDGRGPRQARGEGDQAARAGGRALQGLGGQESRPQQAQERRRDPHRAHRGRAHANLRRARAAAGAQRRRHRREGGAASGQPRREDARRPQADRHRPADDRRRRPHRAARGQRRGQVDAAVDDRRRLRSGARAL